VASVLADAGLPLTYRGRLWATSLVIGAPMAFGVQTAAAMMRWSEASTDIDVVVPRDRHGSPPPACRLWRALPADAPTVLRQGLLVTHPALTLAHCLRFLPLTTARDILDRSQQVGGPPLSAVAGHLTSRGRGTAQARRLLDAADGSRFAAERLAVRTLRAGRITGFTLNTRVTLDGVIVVIDIAFEPLKIAIEIDGFAYHATPDRFQGDRTRQNALMADGWLILRFPSGGLAGRRVAPFAVNALPQRCPIHRQWARTPPSRADAAGPAWRVRAGPRRLVPPFAVIPRPWR